MTHENWIPGNLILTKNGDKAKILARMENVIIRSAWQVFDTYGSTLTIEDCIKAGYYVMKPGDRIPMEMEEIEKMFGHGILPLRKGKPIEDARL